jgi:hypothetical protein
LVEDHQVWSVLNRADYMLGYSRFALILVGIDDGQPLNMPVRGGRHKVTYLQPYSEIGTKIIEYEVDPASPRFGLPKIYQISMAEHEQGQADRAIGAIRPDLLVHYSRVVHIADNVVEDPVFGIPRLEPVYNLLTDLLKIAGGTAETYWITSNRGMQLDIDKEMTLDPEEEAALDAEVNEYYHNLRRVIRTRGVKVNELGAKVADPSMSIGNVLSLISATTRIPQRILLGSEAGQLASEQDRANWAERVGERRNKFAEPFALLPFIARVVNMGIVPRPGALKFKWPEAFILGPLERAQTSAQMARSAANLLKVLLEKPEFISIPEARSIVGFGDETTLLDEGKIAGSGLPPT